MVINATLNNILVISLHIIGFFVDFIKEKQNKYQIISQIL
jgi:hypothetical protein